MPYGLLVQHHSETVFRSIITQSFCPGERKLKVQLLKTCVGAIPRIIPEGLHKASLVELISKLTIHMDKDLSSTAVETLKNNLCAQIMLLD